jgi:hypothetical protein
VGCACIERFPRYTRSGVEGGGAEKIHVGGYDDVVGGIEVGVLLVADVGVERLYGDARVELLDLGGCCFGALLQLARGSGMTCGRYSYVLAHVSVTDEELRAQVIFGDYFVIGEGNGAYAGEHQVFCDFVGEGFDGD